MFDNVCQRSEKSKNYLVCQNKRETFFLHFIIELEEGIYSANYTLSQVVYMNTDEMIETYL